MPTVGRRGEPSQLPPAAMAACASLCLLCPVRVQVLGVAPARRLPRSPTPLTIAGAWTPQHSPPGGTGAVLKGPCAVKSSVRSKGQDVHGWIRAWGGYAPGEQQAGGPRRATQHRAVTWTPGASETLPTRAHVAGAHVEWRDCAPPRGDEPGARGAPVPESSSCTGPACRQGTTHSQKPGCRPGRSRGSATSPPGHAGCVAQGDKMRLCCREQPWWHRGLTQGEEEPRHRDPTPRGGSRPARPRHAPAPTPASASQTFLFPVLDLILTLGKKKKKDTCAFEVGTMATPAALPPQGPVSSSRSQHAPHPPGRLSPSRALATATLLLLVGGPGGAQQPGAKEPALCPGDLHTGLHWVSTERSCPAWGAWGRTRGAPASAPGPLLTKEDALLVGGLLEDPGTAHPGEVQAGGGGRQ